MRLLSAAQQLLSVIQRDEDLLKYDYMFSFSGRKKRPSAGGEGGFHVRGLTGTISTRPHGYCHVNLVQVAANGMGRLAEYLDMRIRETLETDDLGTLRIHRKSAEMQWLDTLPPLIEFIKTRSAKQLVIEHYD